MKIFQLLCIFILLNIHLIAQNPIVPAGVYIADPSAHVWSDGKMYLYGSLDESTKYYCSWRHHVLVSNNMKDWTIYEDGFASKGTNDQVSYSDALLFAPDCQYKNGNYYLYYCQPDINNTEGVAISSSPVGPFLNGKRIELKGYNEIDPSVFIDANGEAYYLWGQFTLKMGKLKPNMIEIDQTTIKDSIITESEHFFHEGAYLTKRNGIYYIVYTHIGRAGIPTCIGYATSLLPMGPYKYRGVIIDNDHCDPGNWNNHGSIAEFKGKWYVFYHRATHNSRMMRKACVEPISFNEDGSITEVEMTSQGAGNPLLAVSKIDAERACLLFGDVVIQSFKSNNEELALMKNEDQVAFKYIDFGTGVTSVNFMIKSGENDASIDLKLDTPWGPTIGKVSISKNNGQNDWQSINTKITDAKGIHALWLVFSGKDGENKLDFAIDWLKFER